MKKKYLVVLLLLTGFLNIYAQLEASNWFFGERAGLDFTPPPTTTQTGQLNTIEGCSSISDPCGELLIYTDGITVYDRNHNVMPNGNGLHGDPSSSQSGLIVPHPGNQNLYYVFTVDDDGGSYGLQYSLVDMTLNGGTGDIVAGQKNIPLIANIREKVTAVANVATNEVWVVTVGTAPQNGNTSFPINTYNAPRRTFYAIKIDASGIASNAVVTTLPTSFNINSAHGYMKLSTAGDKVAIANYYDRTLYLLDFDINTGIPSNLAILTLPNNFGPYGVEFSPNGDFLYVQGLDGYSTSNGTVRILQYDLRTPPYTYQQIASYNGFRGALQLGIDGKIYVTESDSYSSGRAYLSTINNPNNPGVTCNFAQNSVSLAPGTMSRQGLPQFIQSYFVTVRTLDATSNVESNAFCEGSPILFSVSTNFAIDHVEWIYGDGNTDNTPPLASDPQTSETTHTYATAGNYTVEVHIYNNSFLCNYITVSAQITIHPLPEVNGISDLELCDVNRNGLVTFDPSVKDPEITSIQTDTGPFEIHYYESLSDAQNQTNEISNPYTTTQPYSQEIWFSVKNAQTGCIDYGSFFVQVNPLPQIYPVSPLEECDDNDDGIAVFNLSTKLNEILNGRNPSDYTVTFYETQTDAENNTNPLSDPYTNTTPSVQTVYYTITDNATGCSDIGSFELHVLPKPEIVMDDNYFLCQGNDVYIEAPAGFVSYSWSTGDTSQGITVSSMGDYTVTVTDSNGCTNSKTVHVDESGPPTIEKITTVDFENGNNGFKIYVSGIGEYEFSIDQINYQDDSSFTGLKAGTYTAYARDKHGCGEDSEEVNLMDAPPYFTPNGDGYHDLWQVTNILNRPGTKVYIYDRFGRLLRTLEYNDEGWDGTFSGIALPSDDYWFEVLVPPGSDKSVVRGHFTLKR